MISKSIIRRIAMQTGSSIEPNFDTIPEILKPAREIVRNRCQCNVCKDIIESKSVHDWVQCQCGRIFTDGGREYLHRGFVEATDLIDLTEYLSELQGVSPLTQESKSVIIGA